MDLQVIDGESQSVEDVELEALREIHDVTTKHAAALRAMRSPLRRWVETIESSAENVLLDREERRW